MRDSSLDYYLRGMNTTPARKAPTKRVRKAFDRDALKRICEMHEDEFYDAYDMKLVSVGQRYPDDYYCFLDKGSSVLAVAHLDTVVNHNQRTCQFLDTAGGGTVVYSGALDDRLGAYTILEWLPALGHNFDILLTVGEESGCSTAQFFDPPEGKDYDWIIEFDRGGTDVVMYDYEDSLTRSLVRQAGAQVGQGSFSDIAYLEHLGRKAFNWGIGYRDYHGPRGHAYLDDTFLMVSKFLNFHEDNEGLLLPHTMRPSKYWWDDEEALAASVTASDDESERLTDILGRDYVPSWAADDEGEPLGLLTPEEPDLGDLVSDDPAEVSKALVIINQQLHEEGIQ